MEDLMKLRESIDEIDSEIVRLYKERMDISKHVAEPPAKRSLTRRERMKSLRNYRLLQMMSF